MRYYFVRMDLKRAQYLRSLPMKLALCQRGRKPTVLEQLEKSKLTTEKVQLVLAVDNDEAGRNLFNNFQIVVSNYS